MHPRNDFSLRLKMTPTLKGDAVNVPLVNKRVTLRHTFDLEKSFSDASA